jgi:hypothetical protein
VETQAVRVFYPHGIGHTLGLDVHDTRGGRRRRLPRGKSGRLRFRARLEPGFVITIEPGVYFMPVLLHDRDVQRKHRGRIDFGRAEQFLGVGGVRIETTWVSRTGPPPHPCPRRWRRSGGVRARLTSVEAPIGAGELPPRSDQSSVPLPSPRQLRHTGFLLTRGLPILSLSLRMLLVSALTALACRKAPEPGEKKYPLTGVVASVNRAVREVVVATTTFPASCPPDHTDPIDDDRCST